MTTTGYFTCPHYPAGASVEDGCPPCGIDPEPNQYVILARLAIAEREAVKPFLSDPCPETRRIARIRFGEILNRLADHQEMAQR